MIGRRAAGRNTRLLAPFMVLLSTLLPVAASGQTNHWPVAIVGSFVRTVVGAQVTLSGEGADPDGDPITYKWRQGDRPAVLQLNGSETSVVSFTPTTAGVYTIVLTVLDNRGGSG